MQPSESFNLTANPSGQDGEEGHFDWRGVLATARTKLWLLILLPVIGGGAGWAYLQKTPNTYEARATLEFEEKQNVVKFDDVSAGSLESREAMNTVSATITSRSMLEFVAERDRLYERPGLLAPGTKEKTPQAAAARMAGMVKAVVRKDTRLLDIFVTSEDPRIAKDVAESVAAGVIRYGIEQKARAAGFATEFLVQEADRLKKKLESSELALQKYRDDNNAISLEDNQNLVVDQLKDMSTQFSSASTARVQLETDFATIDAMKDASPETLLQLKSVASLPAVLAVTQAMAAKESEFSILKQRYKHKHPKYTAMEAEVNNLRDQLKLTLADSKKLLQATYEASKVNEEKFRTALSSNEQKAMDLNRMAIQYNVLKREMETDKSLYDSVLARLKEVDLTKGLEKNELSIQDLPQIPSVPVWPSFSKVMTASVGAGMMVAVGIILLVHFMDRTIKTVDQAEKTLGLSVMAAVGRSKTLEKDVQEIVKEPHGAVAESFRSLRVMTTLLGPESERRVFLLTSALPSEGKTFCSANFAISLAQQGLRTLIIDADLRKPRVSMALFGENRKPGLTELLVGKHPIQEVCHRAETENLYVIPAGEKSPNPAELLAGKQFPLILEQALKHFDRVIIDTAPVIAVSDTLLLLPYVQTVMLVVKWSSTPKQVIQRAIGMLRGAGKIPSGIVLNQMPAKSGSYYYYYSPGYYGSKGVYGASA